MEWIDVNLPLDTAYFIKDDSPSELIEYDFCIYFQYACFLSEDYQHGFDNALEEQFVNFMLADDYTFELITPQTVGVYKYEED